MDRSLLKQITEGQLIVNFFVNTDKTPAVSQSVQGLQARLDLLESYWAKVLNRHGDLEPTEDEKGTQPYWQDDLFSIYEQKYIEFKMILNQRLATLLPLPAGGPPVPVQSAMITPSATASLPKLSLPKFSGDQLDWETFKERFTSIVINVPSYSKVTKLQYLQVCLEGSAAKRFNNLELTNANFDVAWDGLVKRYDNKRVRLTAHLSKVLSLPTILQRTAAGITSLLDEVDEALRALKSLSRPTNQWDDRLIEIITSRLDDTLREDWEKTLEGQEAFPTYTQLVEFLESRARTFEAAQSVGAFQSKQHSNNKNSQNGQRIVSSHHSSATNSSNNQPPQQKVDALCVKGTTLWHLFKGRAYKTIRAGEQFEPLFQLPLEKALSNEVYVQGPLYGVWM